MSLEIVSLSAPAASIAGEKDAPLFRTAGGQPARRTA
jgi:hypothetical protein